MGFTPWPYEATLAGQDEIYSFIDSSADMIAHHMDAGVPWPEAVTSDNFENYGANLKDEVNGRLARTAALNNKIVYLGVSPFSSLRDELALYWNTSPNQNLPSPWDTYDFGNASVVTAYTNYMDELIKKFNPDFINFAVEANEYYHNVPAERGNLVSFLTSVYTELKTRHPTKSLMISFAMSSPGSAKMVDTASFFDLIKDHVDIVGMSIYPYAFYSHADKGNPANLPSDWFSQITSVAPGKPYFVAETGFLGESLSIPSFGLNVTVTEDMQADYIEELFSEMNNLNVLGVVWFSPYDFDTLWSNLLNDDFSLVWRDTGLKDGNQNPRKALSNWNSWLSYSKN